MTSRHHSCPSCGHRLDLRSAGPLSRLICTGCGSDFGLQQRSAATLTPDRLRQLISYDPTSGLFYWIRPTQKSMRAGSLAGVKNADGYVSICIDYRKYQAHRLAFLFMDGVLPVQIVDHIDGDPSNNRWANLRLVTNSQSQVNQGLSVRNKSGFRGVWWNAARKKWQANTSKDNRTIYIGLFDDIEEAKKAYIAAAQALHGPYVRGLTQVVRVERPLPHSRLPRRLVAALGGSPRGAPLLGRNVASSAASCKRGTEVCS